MKAQINIADTDDAGTIAIKFGQAENGHADEGEGLSPAVTVMQTLGAVTKILGTAKLREAFETTLDAYYSMYLRIKQEAEEKESELEDEL